MKAVITGSIAFDYLMSFPGHFTDVLLADHLENISLSFLVDSLKRYRGGNAPNIAYTLALLGGQPRIMATAGQDFGEYRAWLDAHGIDTSAIVEVEGEYCSSFFVNTDQSHNQIASFYAGAMKYASQLTFTEHAADADLAIISPNDPAAMRAYVAECKTLGINYIYDPSQQTARLSGEDLRDGLDGCLLLTVNEYEFCLIQDKTGLSESRLMQLARGVLVTKGSAGAWLRFGDQDYHIPPYPPRKVVEPTGAGDAFRAGLMRGIQLGLPWEITGRMGALAATYVLEHLGTQSHYFTVAEFVDRFRQGYDDEGALDALLATR